MDEEKKQLKMLSFILMKKLMLRYIMFYCDILLLKVWIFMDEENYQV